VSYHFEGQAERVESDPAILKIIQEVEEKLFERLITSILSRAFSGEL